MKRMKDMFLGSIVTVLIIGVSISAFAAYNRTLNVTYTDIKLTVNGERFIPKDKQGSTIEPFISNGTTYLPVRAVAGINRQKRLF
jgi:hypothetical protein